MMVLIVEYDGGCGCALRSIKGGGGGGVWWMWLIVVVIDVVLVLCCFWGYWVDYGDDGVILMVVSRISRWFRFAVCNNTSNYQRIPVIFIILTHNSLLYKT